MAVKRGLKNYREAGCCLGLAFNPHLPIRREGIEICKWIGNMLNTCTVFKASGRRTKKPKMKVLGFFYLEGWVRPSNSRPFAKTSLRRAP